nr:immunoglobulin light chain junction region [Macaca mulatta]MOX75855.1 immunoglobulin light chain junction region [Macaca mulatta]
DYYCLIWHNNAWIF